VRWYLRYALSYRDLEEMMRERGLSLDHTTIYRWVQAYAPELEKRIRPHLRPTNDSYRVDETYVKIKGEWQYSLPRRRFDGTNDRFHVEREKRCEGRQTVLPQDAQGRIALISASDQRR
jgi:hypothetical protein